MDRKEQNKVTPDEVSRLRELCQKLNTDIGQQLWLVKTSLTPRELERMAVFDVSDFDDEQQFLILVKADDAGQWNQAEAIVDSLNALPALLTELEASQSRVRELEGALRGVVAVADRKTDEFDRARAALSEVNS